MKIKSLVCYIFATFWLGVILACGGAPNRPTVAGESSSRVSQDLWERCVNPIRQMQCRGDMVYSTICTRRIADEYFALHSLDERKAHLIRYGCPPAMVQ